MITIKQLEELINNTDDTKTIKYVDENKRTITPNENSIIENIDYTKDFKEGPFGDVYKTNYTITINNNKTNMSNHLDDPQKGLKNISKFLKKQVITITIQMILKTSSKISKYMTEHQLCTHTLTMTITIIELPFSNKMTSTMLMS